LALLDSFFPAAEEQDEYSNKVFSTIKVSPEAKIKLFEVAVGLLTYSLKIVLS
jgi:hypothetical protein